MFLHNFTQVICKTWRLPSSSLMVSILYGIALSRNNHCPAGSTILVIEGCHPRPLPFLRIDLSGVVTKLKLNTRVLLAFCRNLFMSTGCGTGILYQRGQVRQLPCQDNTDTIKLLLPELHRESELILAVPIGSWTPVILAFKVVAIRTGETGMGNGFCQTKPPNQEDHLSFRHQI
jgi:hypothetical protein